MKGHTLEIELVAPILKHTRLEAKGKASLAREELRNHYRGRSDKALRPPKDCRTDVVSEVAAEIGAVGEIECLEEELRVQFLPEAEAFAEVSVQLENTFARAVVAADVAVSTAEVPRRARLTEGLPPFTSEPTPSHRL